MASDAFIFCNMVAIVALAIISTGSHNYHFFQFGEQLRSSHLASVVFIIQFYCL